MITRIEKALAERRLAIKEGEKGFTLIELLVVVIIIGILAAIAIPIYIGVQNNAKDSAVKSDISNAKTAVVAYYTDKGVQTPNLDLTGLDNYGFSVPASTDSNYGTAPSLEFSTAGGFCIAAISVTGKHLAASDTTGVSEGICTGGVWAAYVAP